MTKRPECSNCGHAHNVAAGTPCTYAPCCCQSYVPFEVLGEEARLEADPGTWRRALVNERLREGGHVHTAKDGVLHCAGGDAACPLWGSQLDALLQESE